MNLCIELTEMFLLDLHNTFYIAKQLGLVPIHIVNIYCNLCI